MDRNYLKGSVGDRINAVLARPATTSACPCDGSQNSCVPSSAPSPKLSRLKRSLKSALVRVLHGGRKKLRNSSACHGSFKMSWTTTS
jgi:hypothetical protein